MIEELGKGGVLIWGMDHFRKWSDTDFSTGTSHI